MIYFSCFEEVYLKIRGCFCEPSFIRAGLNRIHSNISDNFFQYALDRLKMMCEETLAYNLSVDTVCNVLILADLHNAQNLKSIAIDFTNR